jgi:hypothetical protein
LEAKFDNIQSLFESLENEYRQFRQDLVEEKAQAVKERDEAIKSRDLIAIQLETEREHHRELRDENKELINKVLELTSEASTLKGRLAEKDEREIVSSPQAPVTRIVQKPKVQAKKSTTSRKLDKSISEATLHGSKI